ncbi:hypothetical protein [Streptomyces qinglanensis]|uniref:hypothetical protein n=1 Tax=Streptomyces qinglanensis TaxID=943816 RepID=UPI003D727845
MKVWKVALGLVIALFVISAVVWWIRPKEEDQFVLPERVCGDVFLGKKIQPLLQGVKSEVEVENIRDFPGSRENTSSPVCEMRAKGRSVAFRVDHPSYPEKQVDIEKENRFVVQLGSAYGVYAESSGTMILEIPCPTKKESDVALFLNVGASMAREGEKGGRAKLADLTGYAARTLAQNVYKCKGADKLPEGPVHIKKGEGTR